MSKWWLGLASALLLVTGAAQAQKFEEGVHYEVIADEPSSDKKIEEFFSFYCVHCFRFEPIAQSMKQAYPEAFTKSHVSFISPDGAGETMTQAFAAAQKLDIEAKMIEAIFNYNFVEQNMLTSKQDIRNAFIVNGGVAGEKFDKAMSSFAVRAAASQMDRRASKMNVNATPTFIVNDQYKMLPQGFRDSDDFAADFTELAGFLLEK